MTGIAAQQTAVFSFADLPEPATTAWRWGGGLLLGIAVHGLLYALLQAGPLPQVPPKPPVALHVRMLEQRPAPPVIQPQQPKPPAEPAKPVRRVQPVPPPRSVPPPVPAPVAKPLPVAPVPVAPQVPMPPVAPVVPAAEPLSKPAEQSAAIAPPRVVQPSTPPVPAPAPAVPVVAARYDADYLHNPKPAYPAMSRRLGEEGRVLLKVRVSADGMPLAIAIESSSGIARLDDAARAAVERWRFVPARRGDAAIESSVLVPLAFSLN